VANEDGINRLYRNDWDPANVGGQMTFTMTTSVVSELDWPSRGCCWGDYDNDGDLDLFVAIRFHNNFLYQNNGNSNNWINIRCVGTASNWSAIGARVSLKATFRGASVWQTREISGQTGRYGQNSLNAEFGLADAVKIDSIRVRWPSGTVQEIADVEVNQFITITEPQFVPMTNEPIVNDGGRSFGCSWGDYDNDGDQDVFVANYGENNFLYKNDGTTGFIPITTGDIVTDGGNSQSGAWGDYDNDGDLDLFVCNLGVNYLYKNKGGDQNVTFTRMTTGPIATDDNLSKGSCWGDYDNDGDLDLFVANYGSQNNSLYRNDPDPPDPESLGQTTKDSGSGQAPSSGAGRIFTPITTGIIVTDGGDSYGCNWVDYDNDDDLDLFVSNIGFNFLYRNDGPDESGEQEILFTRLTQNALVTNEKNSIGGSWGDYDSDGDLDVYVTWQTFGSDVGDNLFRNDGADLSHPGEVKFSPVAIAGVEGAAGASWGDYDNDGDLDLMAARNGDNVLFRNDGKDIFTRITDGAIVNDGGNSQGTGWADFDNDGTLDLFVANNNENNFLYKTTKSRNHWLNIRLEGRTSNRSGIGARVTVMAVIDGFYVEQMREISTQTGYLSQNSLNAEFGLGDATIVDSIQVEWPLGAVNRYDNVPISQFLTLVENNRPGIAHEIPVTTLSSDTTEFVLDLKADSIFIDLDGDELTYTLTSSDTNIAKADISEGVLTVTLVDEKAPGKAVITIEADDGRVDDGRGDTEILRFAVNRPPLFLGKLPSKTFFQSHSVREFIEDLTTVFFEFDTGDKLEFKVSSDNSTITTAWVEHPVLYVALGDSEGTAIIRVTADDGNGGVADAEFRVTNKLSNDPPVVSSTIPNITLLVDGQSFTKNLNDIFVDADGDPLNFIPRSTDNSVAFARILKDTLLVVEPHSQGKATITVRAFDPVGEEASIRFEVEVLPSFRPDITHTPIISHNSGLPVSIEANITDDEDSLAIAILNYRTGGDADFVSVLMTESDNAGYFNASIPAAAVTSRGAEYFIYAEDVHGVERRKPESGVISIQVGVGVGLTKTNAQPGGNEKTDYRLISIPLELDNQDPGAVLEDDLGEYNPTEWRFIQWVSSSGELTKPEYPNTTPMEPGKAFWLIVKTSGKIIDSGAGSTVSTSKRFEIELNRGWNLIANPFNFSSFAEDTLSNGGEFDMYYYDGEYSDALDPNTTELQPFEGYAVHSEYADTMLIKANPYDTMSVLSREIVTEEDQVLWSIRIRASCRNARDNNNVAAVTKNASREWDRLDHPEPPGVGEYVSVYFPHTDWERYSRHFSTDIRPEFSDGDEWEFEVKTNIHDVVNLTFKGLETIPADYEVWLVDKTLKIKSNLRHKNSYSAAGRGEDNPKNLTLVVGRQDYMANKLIEFQLVPTTVELSHNFPNPFNPSTTIRYGLPNPNRTTLTVYNILGKKVKTLINSELMEAGYHAAVWDGRDDAGRAVANGTYIIRMQAGSFVQVRKMLLLE